MDNRTTLNHLRRTRPWLAALALLALSAPFVMPATQAQDQTKMVLRLGPVILAEANKETILPVAVEPADAAPPRSFLRIRGLPPTIALSDGYALGPGIWAVPLRAIPDLRIVVPAGLAQRSDVLFTLVSLDGSILAEATSQLIIAPSAKLTDQIPAQPATAEPTARAGVARGGMAALGGPVTVAPAPPVAPPPPPVVVAAAPPIVIPPAPALIPVSPPAIAPVPDARLPRAAALVPPAAAPAPPAPIVQSLPPAELQRLQRLIERGDEQLAEGSIAAARLLYTRAADAGHAQGALSLGATYDPNELQRLKVVGIRPDIEAARTWYRKALALGAQQAVERIRRLEGR
jgi:hypothetical protein